MERMRRGGIGRRRERKERGRERKEVREEGRGGEGSWNRAADWLRPVLSRRPPIAEKFGPFNGSISTY